MYLRIGGFAARTILAEAYPSLYALYSAGWRAGFMVNGLRQS
ncbi:hypothetical protein [Mesorhizobium sp. ANAO-SY3R2]